MTAHQFEAAWEEIRADLDDVGLTLSPQNIPWLLADDWNGFGTHSNGQKGSY